MVALTGTPGTGKTSVAGELRLRGHEVLDLNGYAAENDLLGERDEARDTSDVDVDALRDSLAGLGKGRNVVAEGHLAHFLDCDKIVVLRCHPDALAARLRARGYAEGKVSENVAAEILDVIFCESLESGAPVYEIDTTSSGPASVAETVEGIMTGKGNYAPGKGTDWSGEMEKWF
ncbi:MAG: AAA family ATPase [Thermoplasmatales archaeon]|nr:AAA family ATPase [Thermoplasmatales archaeon]